MEAGFIGTAFIYLSTAVVCVAIAHRLGLGSVLGYLIGGMLIGPAVLGFIGQEGQELLHIAEFGVVMMLFLVGLELEPSLLWKLRTPILGLGGMQVLLSGLILGAIAMALGLPWKESMAIGIILAMSSTAIALQIFQEKGWMNADAGKNGFSILLFQDIAVIPILALLPFLASYEVPQLELGHSDKWIHHQAAWVQAIGLIGAVVVIVLAGRTFIRPILRLIAGTRSRELFTAAALLLVFATALLMDTVGLSPALGTFLAGVILANSEYRHELVSDIEPFKGLLLGLFFLAVGASIDLLFIQENIGLVLSMVILIVAIKYTILYFLGKRFKQSTDQNLILATTLSQIGEFGFVLISFSLQGGILQEETSKLLTATVALSMALTPLLVLVHERLVFTRIGTKQKITEIKGDTIEEQNAIIIAGFGRFGNIAGRFLRANGIMPTILDYDSDRVEILRKLGLRVYYGDATRLDMLIAAGAEKAKAIIIALDSADKNSELVHLVRKHFPHLQLFVRSFDRSDTYDLMELGAQNIYRDTMDTALRLGKEALTSLGIRAHTAHRAAQRFYEHEERALQYLAEVRKGKDRTKYLNEARRIIHEMEEVMQNDNQSAIIGVDEAWDVESLREEILSRVIQTEKPKE